MPFKADLHIHTDYSPERRKWHGERPKKTAQAIHSAGLDIFATTEHAYLAKNRFVQHFLNIQAELERLSETTNREITGILGVETTIKYEGGRYHIGYLFENEYRDSNAPEILPPMSDVKELEHYRLDFPGAAILCHPTWKDHPNGNNDPRKTIELMESGLIDGAEILNGAMLFNGAPIQMTIDAIRMFIEAKWQRQLISAIGSSDAHKAQWVGNVVTLLESKEKEKIFEALKKGDTTPAPIEETVVKPKVERILREVNTATEIIKL
jgi:hypothetical protein